MSLRQALARFRLLAPPLLLIFAALTSAPASATTTYEYDALGRVTKVTYDDGSYVEYHYDAAGNRTTVTGTKH